MIELFDDDVTPKKEQHTTTGVIDLRIQSQLTASEIATLRSEADLV